MSIGKEGAVSSLPSHVSDEQAQEQFLRAEQYGEFASDAASDCVLSFMEYRLFCEVVQVVFQAVGAEIDA